MTAIREALQQLRDLCALTKYKAVDTEEITSAIDAVERAALSQEVPQESVPAGYVLVDLNEYDGDDPRADADTDRWMAAADAFVKANPHNMRGLAEWECQMRAAINVLATLVRESDYLAERKAREAAEAKIAELNSINSKLCEMMDEELENAKEWEAKAEAAEADARRYRWLRVQGHKDIAACWLLPRPYPEPLEITNPEDFAAAIDAAIRSTQEQHRG